MSLLTIIQSVLMGLERDKYTSVIHDELNKLVQSYEGINNLSECPK